MTNRAERKGRIYGKIKLENRSVREIIWSTTAHNRFPSTATWKISKEIRHFGMLTDNQPFTCCVSTPRAILRLHRFLLTQIVHVTIWHICFSLITADELPGNKQTNAFYKLPKLPLLLCDDKRENAFGKIWHSWLFVFLEDPQVHIKILK